MGKAAMILVIFFVSCKTMSKPIPALTITLGGSDSEGSFYWRQLSGETVVINGVNSKQPKVVFKKRGLYQFELSASVGKEKVSDSVKVKIK